MSTITRPRIVARPSNHPGTHRIEFDVTAARQKVRPRVHQTCLVAPFPQGARATVATIEQPGIVPRERMHQARQGSLLARRHQQVHVVAHQYIGMQPAPKSPQHLPQALQVALAVEIIQKAWQSIVAPLHHMLRNAGKIKARLASHAHSFAGAPADRCQRKPRLAIVQIALSPSGIVPDTLFGHPFRCP